MAINYIKPLIKWVGGKTQIIDKVIENFPKEINNYHELFVGGGSVLLALLQNVKEKKITIKKNCKIYAYDLNETLINMYKNVQTKPHEVLAEIKLLISIYNEIDGEIVNRKPKNIEEGKTSQESFYYWIRAEFNSLKEHKNTPKGTAYFIFLNKTCFRGVYRESSRGYNNVPFGNYKNPEIINDQHLIAISDLIKDVIFTHSGFELSLTKIKKNDFVYLDPPYAPENKTSFVGYTKDGFTLEQHIILFTECKKYKFLMSNAYVDLVKNSFIDKKYTTIIIPCKRTINSKNPESITNEVLIKSF